MAAAPSGLTLLLGAGASSEAGLPASVELTRSIACRIEGHTPHRQAAQALNFAIGAMVAHDTARGLSAFTSVDVERLFSTVQMLGQRDAVELTPFVAAWNPALEAIGSSTRMPTSFRRNFGQALTERSDYSFESLFRQGVEAIVGRRSEPVFQWLEREMVSALRDVLKVTPKAVEYLRPVVNYPGHPVQIATLNYDRTIETVAEMTGRTCDTGVATWSGGFDWTWADSADIRLLKLHGSVDWWYVSKSRSENHLPEEGIVVDAGAQCSSLNSRPAVIFGQRGKLRSDGPSLAMLRAFDDFLARSVRLVIVGYSFRDEHVNTSIRRWFNKVPEPRVTIIDPALIDLDRRRIESEFLGELLRAITVPKAPSRIRPPHQVLTDPASVALQTCFGAIGD